MRLAHELGKTESEIMDLSPDEFGRWVAYFRLEDEREAKERRRQNRNGFGYNPGR